MFTSSGYCSRRAEALEKLNLMLSSGDLPT
jgi:hypothetical protein